MSPVTAITGAQNPTSETVAIEWLSLLVGALTNQAPDFGTDLPTDTSAWSSFGFVQVRAIPGSTASVDIPQVRHPVLQVDAWGCNPRGIRPPWALAGRAMELVRSATEAAALAGWSHGKPITVPAPYRTPRVQAGYFISEPTRVPDDPSGYARFTAMLALDWAVV